MHSFKNPLQLSHIINKAMEVFVKNFNQKIAVFTVLVSSLLCTSLLQAANPIHFEGPKITDLLTQAEGQPPIKFPENFAGYDFVGANTRVDEAVPLACMEPKLDMDLIGMNNLDNWGGAINTYFNQQYTYVRPMLRQVAEIQAGNGPKKDLVVVSDWALYFCYEYNGSTCSVPVHDTELSLYAQHTPGGPFDPAYKISPWRGVTADMDGDGKDDFVVIGHDANMNGYVVHIDINNDATPVVKSALETPHGIPLSLDVGQFDTTTPALDVATGIWPRTAPQAWIDLSTNNAGTLAAPVQKSAPIATCYQPTGLVTWNPDANASSDLVLTCYSRPEGLGNAPVITFKYEGGFVPQQTIEGFKAPYESTLADYNGDGKKDLAVADNAGMAITVIAGGGADPFSFDLASRNNIPTLPYTPKFIQTHQMDDVPGNATLLDIVSTASRVYFPPHDKICNPKAAYVGSFKSVSRTTVTNQNTKHGVLVLLNRQPKISLDEPTCNTVTAHCTPATVGGSISACSVSSAEPWFASANPQVTPNGSGKDVKFTVPAGQTIHFTINATENPGAITSSENFERNIPSCPNPQAAVCPVTKLETAVWVDDPWSLCVPDTLASEAVNASGSAGPQVIWSQSVGANIFAGGSDSYVVSSITNVGTCLNGRFKFPDDDVERVYEGTYSIKNPLTNTFIVEGCRWSIVSKPALIEGSGRCGLSTGPVSFTQILFGLLLGLSPLTVLYSLRRQKEK